MAKSSRFSFSNIFTALLIIFTLVMLFNPEVKGWVIQKLMVLGLFQPDIEKLSEPETLVSEQIAFSDVNGRRIILADLKGKVVFINFWATWCPPCIAEMPSINSLINTLKSSNQIVFLITDADGNFNSSREFMQKENFNLPLYIPASEMPKALFSGSLPTTVILNKQGKVVFKESGAADYSSKEMLTFIRELVLSSP